jgi:hypothetical protein
MTHGAKGDKAPDLEPWIDDERLKDVLQMGSVIRDIKLIQKLAEALENAPIAPMPKTESIPLLREKTKELKPKKIEDLIHTCHEHGDFKMSVEKLEEDLLRAKFARKDAEREKKACDKRTADEMSSADEDERSSSKERKRTSSGINTDIFNDEGTCTNSNSQLHVTVAFVAHTCFLLLLWFKQCACFCLVRLLGCTCH